MKPQKLLQAIAEAGGKITIDGNDLVLCADHPLPHSLLYEARVNKAALLVMLTDTTDDMSRIPFNEEAMHALKAGKALKIWSDVLQEWLYWVRDEGLRQKLRINGCDLPIYTLGELAVVADMDDVVFRETHACKGRFDATIQALPEEPDS